MSFTVASLFSGPASLWIALGAPPESFSTHQPEGWVCWGGICGLRWNENKQKDMQLSFYSSISEEYLDGPESWPELSIVRLGSQEVTEARNSVAGEMKSEYGMAF